MFDLTGKIALVTGAQGGMGKAHAVALAGQGATVIVTDLNKDSCALVADEIIAQGGSAAAYALDVADESSIDSVISDVVGKFGHLDILVNNAGIFRPKPALEVTRQEWEATLSVNLMGQFLCAQRAAKEMAKNAWGRIINISSIASGQVGIGFAGAAAYTASKGGVIGMTETLAVEWAPLGITVNTIAPGAIQTPMIEGDEMAGAIEALKAVIPMKRIGKPEEVAAVVVFLASEEASYLTGSMLVVDGGWLAT